MKITCPCCHLSGVVEDSFVGRRVKCPKCKARFKVSPPELDTPDLTEWVKTVSVSCPNCGTEGSVDSSFLGRRVSCPQCHWLFTAESDAAPAVDSPENFGFADTPADSFEEINLRTSLEEPPAAERLLTGAKSFPAATLPDEILFTKSVPTDGSDLKEEDVFREVLPEHGQGDEFIASPADRAAMEDSTFEDEPEEAEVDDSWTIAWALGRAWRRTRGFKLVFFLEGVALALSMFLGNVITMIVQSVSGLDSAVDPAFFAADSQIGLMPALGLVFVSFLFAMVNIALIGGMVYTGVRAAAGDSASFSMAGHGFRNLLQLFLAVMVMALLSSIGYAFFVLPGLYLSVAWSMTIPLLVDQRLGIWEAMEMSRKMVTRHWFKIFLLMMIIMPVLVAVSAIPFGIGLIWTIPMFFVLTGVVYQTLYGDRVLR
ncbi:hypothetical protein JWG39_05435 [Desulforhopalus vacuolatus]|uniref:hypothetical protein n=1 Tax=Desulforhopalus vacuolatus TaxID=40414 RepID=UPI0019649412|nr:hypothetical protein [Desulforhopalus vacuolatus]MBM9519263.1 hypothetical protein [Desulforhopalus vacuolatus]